MSEIRLRLSAQRLFAAVVRRDTSLAGAVGGLGRRWQGRLRIARRVIDRWRSWHIHAQRRWI